MLPKLPKRQGKHQTPHSSPGCSQIPFADVDPETLSLYSVSIGLRCKDGIVLAIEKVQTSKLLVKGANKRILSVDNHIGLVSWRTTLLSSECYPAVSFSIPILGLKRIAC
jgi:hypothetical protein